MSYQDTWWCSSLKTGSGVAKTLVLLISTSGGGYCTALDYEGYAEQTEFSVEEIRQAFIHLVVHGFARIDGDMLYLLTPGRLRDEADARAKAEAAAARRAAKVALRGGQVNRRPIPEETRALVLARDGHRCVTCGADEDLTLDHVYPWSLGGPDTPDNLRVLCRPCNSSKGDRT